MGTNVTTLNQHYTDFYVDSQAIVSYHDAVLAAPGP
jgi:hypothetical protein